MILARHTNLGTLPQSQLTRLGLSGSLSQWNIYSDSESEYCLSEPVHNPMFHLSSVSWPIASQSFALCQMFLSLPSPTNVLESPRVDIYIILLVHKLTHFIDILIDNLMFLVVEMFLMALGFTCFGQTDVPETSGSPAWHLQDSSSGLSAESPCFSNHWNITLSWNISFPDT